MISYIVCTRFYIVLHIFSMGSMALNIETSLSAFAHVARAESLQILGRGRD